MTTKAKLIRLSSANGQCSVRRKICGSVDYVQNKAERNPLIPCPWLHDKLPKADIETYSLSLEQVEHTCERSWRKFSLTMANGCDGAVAFPGLQMA